MKQPRLLVSDAAVADILEQADWYSVQSGEALAERWERAVTSSVLRIVNRPAMGTLCTFRSVELRDVRRTTIPGLADNDSRISEASAVLQVPGGRNLDS